jgi:flagellar basal body-associated protein FliL
MQMKSPRKSRRRLLIPILVVIIALVVIASLTILAFLGWRFLRNGGEIFSNIFKIGTASIFTFNLASKTNDASQINSS